MPSVSADLSVELYRNRGLTMRVMKMALAVASAFASTSAFAGVASTQSAAASSQVSTCYYEYTIITEEGVYDVYTCYSNGDGTY